VGCDRNPGVGSHASRVAPEAPLSIRIVPRALGGPALSRAYLAGEAAAFYAGSPTNISAFRYKLAETERRFDRTLRERAAEAIRPTSRRSRERLDRFVREGGAVVTTGQQAGFLTGPLYTIHKALTLVRLSEALESVFGIVVLPVFWTASDDHDWAEVNHAFLGTRSGIRQVELPSDDPRALPMSRRRLEAGIESTLQEVIKAISIQGYTPKHVKSIIAPYRAGRTVSEAFSDSMASLLAEFDILLTDAADPVVNRAAVPVMRNALENAELHEELLRRRGRELRGAGFGEQVAVLDGATNVFFAGDGERERLYRRGGGFVTAGSGRSMSATELLETLEEKPEFFSPNVLLRPVVESEVFPTLAYVAGPGEIAYYGQLGVLYPEFGMEAPVIYPRFAATLVEERVAQELSRLGMDVREMELPRHELVEVIARRVLPDGVSSRLELLGGAIAGGYRDLMEEAEGIDATLHGSLGRLRNESLSRVGRAERKIIRALKRRESDAIARLDRVRDSIYPLDQPQERVLNVLPMLAAEPGLLKAVYSTIEIDLKDEPATGEGDGVGEGADAGAKEI
jgi:bacillithiol biosynthesis cysteine-adding enzyme BshC